jgi:hypothetical protein
VNVVAIHQTSKPHELAREINRLTDGIERDSKLAGQHLATLKAGKPPGITWEHYLRDCGVKISARHADRLIEAYQGPTRKSPIKPKPDSDIVSEPDIENIDGFPDRKTLKPAERKTLYNEGCVLLERMDRETRVKFFEYQEREYHAGFQEERDRFEEEIRELKSEIAKLRQKLDPGRCAWEDTDGGRRAAGYGEPKGDCVARAIAIATEKPYTEVFEALKAASADYVKRWPDSVTAGLIKRSRSGGDPASGCFDAVSGRYLRSIGWEYTRLRERVFLRADQLPRGRLIAAINRHYVAVIDGVIHDIYDSGEGGKRPVKGYWSKAAA